MFLIQKFRSSIANNDYHQDLRVLYTFVSSNSFGQLLKLSQKILYLLKDSIKSFHILIKILIYCRQKKSTLELVIKGCLKYKMILEIQYLLKSMLFYLFLKIREKNTGEKLSKNFSGTCSQKNSYHAKQSAMHAVKTAAKRVVQKSSSSN